MDTQDNSNDIQGWDKLAKKYSDWLDGGNDLMGKAFTTIVTDNVLDLLGDLKGKKILDLGCGEGYLSREMTLRGALVKGIDGSEKMIKLASSKRDEMGKALDKKIDMEYQIGDIAKKLPYEDDQFDLVVCNMVLMDVYDVKSVVKETKRVLQKDGKFIFSIVHPCFFDALGSWLDVDKGISIFVPKRRYIEEVVYMKHLVGLSADVELTHYNRPIQYYVNALLGAEMQITDFRETSFGEQFLRDINLFDELKKYHLTANNLIIGAKKYNACIPPLPSKRNAFKSD
ncbi:putative methyltransferase YcgJ [Anaerolineales bacterium]|nr:putative methyltransferase YcgJ [Anaerolineales bacterium]